MNKFDNSILTLANKCAARAYWRYVRHLVLNTDPNPTTEWGSAIHKGLECLYNGESEEDAIKAFAEYFRPCEGMDDLRSMERGVEYIQKYVAYYFPEPFKVLGVEQHFDIIVEDDIHFTGRLDLAVEDNQGIAVLDHKTTKSPTSVILQPNNQFAGYMWELSKALNTPVNRAIINIIGIVKGVRKTIEASLSRPETTRSEIELEDWRRWFLDSARKFQHYIDIDWFPKESSACFDYFRPCPYTDLCNCDNPIVREKLVAGCYEVEEWKP